MEKVVLYHLNDIIREGKHASLSKKMPKVGGDEVLIGVQTDPTHGNAFEIDNSEVYGRFHHARGPLWFRGIFSLIYILPKEKAQKYLSVIIKSEKEIYVDQERVNKSLVSTLVSHMNKKWP